MTPFGSVNGLDESTDRSIGEMSMDEARNLKIRELDYYSPAPFWETMKRASKQHGYTGAFSSFRFFISKINDYLLHLIAYFSPWTGWRIRCLRKRGVRIGRNVQIGFNVIIDYIFPEYVVLEDGSCLSGQNYILTHTKPLEYFKSDFKSYVAPVVIKRNAWVTIGAVIMPGVTVGEGSVVSPGSVVTKDVPPHSVVAGVPARVIGKLSQDNESKPAEE